MAKTNSTQTFTAKCIVLETPVFDPRLEAFETLKELKKLESRFEKWLESTPDFWYENIQSFEDWTDEVWDWLVDRESEL